jgi:type IV pilus assembly protein PilB
LIAFEVTQKYKTKKFMEYSGLSAQDLKNILVESGVVDETKLKEAERYAEQESVSLAEAVTNRGLIKDEDLTRLVADAANVPFILLSKNLPAQETLAIVPEVVARKKMIIPFKRDEEGIHLAMADPTDLETPNFIERKEGVAVIVYATTLKDIDTVLELYGKGLHDILEGTFREIENNAAKEKKDDDIEQPIVEIMKGIVFQAYRNRASDIHIEPRERGDSVVRFRIDGVLHDVSVIPRALHPQVISRIKVMARLRTDEHQIPQDGKMEIPMEEAEEDQEIDVRVSIVPVIEGEKAVLRLLAERSRQFLLSNIGFDELNLKKIQGAYEKPYGMILVTGPTGCGKTTTLYSILKILNNRKVNIMTIEDPVEYDIEGVSQIQVNPKAKLTFATGLRSILRQDPNVILVGEIRDSETADIAVNLALTGHLVLSTLHTNDAATTIPRLVDLGIEPFLIASTVNVIVAQRLVRKIHEDCRVSEKISASAIAAKIGWDLAEKMFEVKRTSPDDVIYLYRGKGCDVCQKTGFQGRLGVFEIMTISETLRAAISQNKDAGVLRELAKKDQMITMIEDGLTKVKMGVTTIEEVLGATKV